MIIRVGVQLVTVNQEILVEKPDQVPSQMTEEEGSERGGEGGADTDRDIIIY